MAKENIKLKYCGENTADGYLQEGKIYKCVYTCRMGDELFVNLVNNARETRLVSFTAESKGKWEVYHDDEEQTITELLNAFFAQKK